MEKFYDKLIEKITDIGSSFVFKLIGAFLIIFIGIKIAQLIVKLISKGRGFSKLEITVARYLLTIIRTALYAMVFFSAAIVVGVPAASIITMLGSAGLAIGLALQGSLSNIAGSIIIMTMKPFKVGDFIEYGGISGMVKDINLFQTVITTPDNTNITFANSSLANGSIINHSANETRRLEFNFTASKDYTSEKLFEIILPVVKENEKTLSEPEPSIVITKINEANVEYSLRVWAKSGPDHVKLNSEIMASLKKAFDDNSVKITFNQSL